MLQKLGDWILLQLIKRGELKNHYFANLGDSRIEDKDKENIEKYQDLRRELQKIWNVRVKSVPLIVGSLGALPKQFVNRLKETGKQDKF